MTKNQKLRADITSGRTKYLHVSVNIGMRKNSFGALEPSQTPKGGGATARKDPRWTPPA